MKKSILFLAFLFSSVLSTFGQVLFEEHTIVDQASQSSSAKSNQTADLDSDGDLDIITAFNNRIIWYENEDGLGTIGSKHIITLNVSVTSSIFTTDIDGDGDIDLLSASQGDDKIAWYENEDGLGTFGVQQIITTYTDQPRAVQAADLDGDGDMDVISASQEDDKIAWYENEDGLGTFGDQQIITTNADGANSIDAADLDGDGDIDILSSSANDNTISWFKNLDGQGGFNNEVVLNSFVTPYAVYATDLDSDGNMDVLFNALSPTDKGTIIVIASHMNLDGVGTFSNQINISNVDNITGRKIYPEDMDNDGDMDVLFATGNNSSKIEWYENDNGLGGIQHVISDMTGVVNSLYAADLDGDGGMDMLTTSGSKTSWYKNEDGLGDFGNQQFINTPFLIDGPNSSYTADLDGDGDLDLLATSQNNNKIIWYENVDGMGTFQGLKIITTNANGATSVFSTDLDGDGDMDVLSASAWDDKIAWYENEDGLGTFGDQQIISTIADAASDVYAIDLDGDGDMDVISASREDAKIAWYKNEDGLGTFGDQQIITTNANGASAVYSTDLDGDGDMDVISASQEDDKIAWYENEDGLGTFGNQKIITTNADGASDVYAIDIDGDGDMDILSASSWDNKIAWYENEDGLGTFGSHQIITTSAAVASSIFAADIDSDGDLDVLSASKNDNKIAWYENINGLGTFANQITITQNVEGANSVYASDVDGDGDLDVLSTSSTYNKIILHETLGIDLELPIALCQDISISLNEYGSAGLSTNDLDNGSTDNFSIVDYAIDQSEFTCDDLGPNTVTLTVTDIAGNTSSCNSIVTVVDDTPPIVSAQFITINLAGAPSISITPDQIENGSTDNCGEITTVSLDQSVFYTSGEYYVVISVIDISGNVGIGTTIVTVLDIAGPPVVMCQDVSVLLGSSGTADIELSDIDNNSLNDFSIENLEINQEEFTCADIGPNEVILTVTDVLGNEGTCTAIVTVVDNTFTYINTQNITIDLAGQSSITITPEQINNGSVDNCEIISMTLDQDTFTEIGAYEVLFTATDAGNNSKSETAIVTVINSIVATEDLNTFEKKLNIHPIPTTDQITIEASNNISQINIYNTQGQLLISQNTNNVSISNINLTNLAAGLYFCEVKDNEGNIGIRKVIKK